MSRLEVTLVTRLEITRISWWAHALVFHHDNKHYLKNAFNPWRKYLKLIRENEEHQLAIRVRSAYNVWYPFNHYQKWTSFPKFAVLDTNTIPRIAEAATLCNLEHHQSNHWSLTLKITLPAIIDSFYYQNQILCPTKFFKLLAAINPKRAINLPIQLARVLIASNKPEDNR